jgi:hypothetical protein
LRPAVRDYRLFLERGYPESTMKKVVGDRHRLSGEERLILYRGISTEAQDASRRAKMRPPEEVRDGRFLIDFYNIAFTLLNYRLGRKLFRSTDGYIRDAGALHGRLGREERLSWVLEPLLETLELLHPGRSLLFLDAPVSHSGEHARALEHAAGERDLALEASVVESADYPLKQERSAPIATGDSAIIDATETGVVDLSALILRERYRYEPPDLGALLS